MIWPNYNVIKVVNLYLFPSCLADTSPPFSHFGLVALAKHDLIHFWVQLGHDGLVVKAGFPSESTVEVYDSWYGLPQNPYKKDTDLVRREAKDADLVIGKDLEVLFCMSAKTCPFHFYILRV